jgi:hypothetical protein
VDLDPEFAIWIRNPGKTFRIHNSWNNYFKYKMGDFFFWPKNGVSAIKVSLWYFKTKILPFYSLLSGSSSWGNFHWTGRSRSRPLIPFCCLLMVLLPSCLGFVCQEACHCRTFRKLSWSIFIILSRWDSTPLLNEEEDGDLVSPVQMPVEFHILFSIIKASTANQGKRKHMSFLSSVFIWQLIKAIFFFHFFFTWVWLSFSLLFNHNSHKKIL